MKDWKIGNLVSNAGYLTLPHVACCRGTAGLQFTAKYTCIPMPSVIPGLLPIHVVAEIILRENNAGSHRKQMEEYRGFKHHTSSPGCALPGLEHLKQMRLSKLRKIG